MVGLLCCRLVLRPLHNYWVCISPRLYITEVVIEAVEALLPELPIVIDPLRD